MICALVKEAIDAVERAANWDGDNFVTSSVVSEGTCELVRAVIWLEVSAATWSVVKAPI